MVHAETEYYRGNREGLFSVSYRGGTSEVSIFFVVPISRQRGGGGGQLAVVCVSPRPPAWLRLLLLLSFDV